MSAPKGPLHVMGCPLSNGVTRRDPRATCMGCAAQGAYDKLTEVCCECGDNVATVGRLCLDCVKAGA